MEGKQHYKMYKAGKKWLFAAIVSFAFGSIVVSNSGQAYASKETGEQQNSSLAVLNGGKTTSPATTTDGGKTTSPATTTDGGKTTSPATTTDGGKTTSPATTTDGGKTTSPVATTDGDKTTSQAATVSVTLWDDINNKPIFLGNEKRPGFNKNTGTYTITGKPGSSMTDLTLAIPGYKLLNFNDVYSHFKKGDDVFQYLIPNENTTLTLHYVPLSPIQVNYIDEDTGKKIAVSVLPTDWAVPDSGAYINGDEKAPSASKYMVNGLEISGYDLVSSKSVSGTVGQVQISKDNPNPITINFYYKRNGQFKTTQSLDNENGQVIGTKWSTMPGYFSVSGVYGLKYSDDNGDVNAKINELIKKYADQGFTYLGFVGTHDNNDYYNYRQAGIWLHFVPNKNVIVNYVDENGKPLATSDILSRNSNNPNQKNNGIDENNYWYPSGEWQAIAKTINGYTLDTSKTPAKISGKFNSLMQSITFVYKLVNNPKKPVNPKQPVKPTQPAKPAKPAKPSQPKTKTPAKPVKPTQPTKPTQPAKPAKPAKPSQPKTKTPAKPVKPTQPTKPTQLIKTNVNEKKTVSLVNDKEKIPSKNREALPQTGENNSQSQTMSFIGILLAMFGSLLGFLGIKKRRND
jgi:LPXTG-motif cell wall-anchored protein